MNQPYWLKENPLLLYIRTFPLAVKGKRFSLYSLKENPLETKDLKDFPLAATAFFFNA